VDIPRWALEVRDHVGGALDDLEIRRVNESLDDGEWFDEIDAIAADEPVWGILGMASRVTSRWRKSLEIEINMPAGATLVGDFPPEALEMMIGRAQPQVIEGCYRLCEGIWAMKDLRTRWFKPVLDILMLDPSQSIHVLGEAAFVALLTRRAAEPETDIVALLQEESVYRSAENALAIAFAASDGDDETRPPSPPEEG